MDLSDAGSSDWVDTFQSIKHQRLKQENEVAKRRLLHLLEEIAANDKREVRPENLVEVIESSNHTDNSPLVDRDDDELDSMLLALQKEIIERKRRRKNRVPIQSEKMRVSIVSDPPDKVYKSEKPTRSAERSRVHTIKDLPKDDIMYDLFGLGNNPQKGIESNSALPKDAFLNGGRRVRDGAIVYQPSMPSVESLMGNYMFEIIVIVCLLLFLSGLFIGRLVSPPKTKRVRAFRLSRKPHVTLPPLYDSEAPVLLNMA